MKLQRHHLELIRTLYLIGAGASEKIDHDTGECVEYTFRYLGLPCGEASHLLKGMKLENRDSCCMDQFA